MNKSIIVKDTIDQLNSILCAAQEQFSSNSQEFFSQNYISSFSKYIPIVTNLCHVLNVSGIDEIKQHLEDSSFTDLQVRWNNFLSKLDMKPLLSSSISNFITF